MKVFELAMQGRGHVKDSIPCQDKTAAKEHAGVKCVALADGAGSARLSHYGAEIAVNTAVNVLCENFNAFYDTANIDGVAETITQSIYKNIEALAEKYNSQVSDFASTILFVAIKDTFFIIGQLGDGYIAFLRNGSLNLVTAPEKGEFANTTFFTTSRNSSQHLKLFKGELKDIKGFFLMSDGASESLYQRQNKIIAPLVKRILFDTFCKDKVFLERELTPMFEKHIINKTLDDCSIVSLPVYSNYMDFFDSISPQEAHSLFYKTKNINSGFTKDYTSILINMIKTNNLDILSDVTNLNLDTLKRRLRALKKLGFDGLTHIYE